MKTFLQAAVIVGEGGFWVLLVVGQQSLSVPGRIREFTCNPRDLMQVMDDVTAGQTRSRPRDGSRASGLSLHLHLDDDCDDYDDYGCGPIYYLFPRTAIHDCSRLQRATNDITS